MNISGIFAKITVGSIRTTGFLAGAHAAIRVGELGLRAAEAISTERFFAQNESYKKCTNWLKNQVLDVRQRDSNNAENLKPTSLVFKELAVLTLSSIVLTEFCFWCESKPPKIYNMMLTILPIRVTEKSIIQYIKEFKFEDLFKA